MIGAKRLDVFLLRHGIAQPHGTPGVPEDERALTREGRVKTEKAAYGLRRLQPEFDRILSSPLKRAWQTAEIAKRVLGHEDRVEACPHLLPEGSFPGLLSVLRGCAEDDAVLLVGHEPHLGELAGRLIGGAREGGIEFKKGGAGHIELTLGRNAHRGVLRWLLTPKQLRLIGGL